MHYSLIAVINNFNFNSKWRGTLSEIVTTCSEYVLNFTTCVLSTIHMPAIIAHSLHMLHVPVSWKHFHPFEAF